MKHQSPGNDSVQQLNADLLGRSFHAGSQTITVARVGSANPRQVVIVRDFDGKNWSLPAGLVRLILHRARLRQKN